MTGSIEVATGTVLADRYEVRRSSSKGTMTLVEANDTMFNRPARVWMMGGAELCERHREVATTLTAPRHPCLSPLHTVRMTDTPEGPALMAAYRQHEGPDLADLLDGVASEPADAVEIFDQVAAAVAAVHQAGQSLGNLSSRSAIKDSDGAVYLIDPLLEAVAHHGPLGAGPTQQRRDVNALAALVIELLTGDEVPSNQRTPTTLPRLGSQREALRDLDRVLAETVRPDRAPPPPAELALRVRDALVAVL